MGEGWGEGELLANPKNPSSDNTHLTVPHICTTINVVNKHFGPRSTDPGNYQANTWRED